MSFVSTARTGTAVASHPSAKPSSSSDTHETSEQTQASGRLRDGLRHFWLDGVLGETSEIVWFQYFSVFALALDSSVALVGFLAAISSLISTAGISLGAFLAERTKHYRGIAIAGTVAARFAFLMMAVAPWLPTHEAVVVTLIGASLLKGLGSAIALPAWTAFAADAVPGTLRTRFFAFRNFGRQSAGFVLTPLAGLAVGEAAGLQGWQVAWLASFLIGVLAVYFFARVPVRSTNAPVASRAEGRDDGIRSLRPGSPLFLFVTSAFVFQVSVMLVGPFFAVYLVRDLGASPFWVGMTAAASPLSAAVTQAVVSRFFASVRTQTMLVASNIGIVAIPMAWLFVNEPWQVCLINLFGGGLWATSQLATFNLMMTISPQGRLPTFTAVHQGALAAAGFLGPLAGGLLIPALGFKVLLVTSAIGRFGATGLLLRLPGRRPAATKQAGQASKQEVRPPRRPRIVRPPAYGAGHSASIRV